MNKQFFLKTLSIILALAFILSNSAVLHKPIAWATIHPSVTLTANPESINVGDSSTLTWSSDNAYWCKASWVGWNDVSLSGNTTVSPTVNSTYTIKCYRASDNWRSDSVTITVSNPMIQIDTINGQSGPFSFDCQTNPLVSPVTITGSGSSSAPPGQIQQYHVQVVWGRWYYCK